MAPLSNPGRDENVPEALINAALRDRVNLLEVKFNQ